MRLPEFLIGGAPRSGTTWLYALLDRHPDIHMAKPLKPEPKFFLRDDEYAKGLEYYSKKWFEGVDASKIAGEKSTDYLESADAAAFQLSVYAKPRLGRQFLIRVRPAQICGEDDQCHCDVRGGHSCGSSDENAQRRG